MSDINVSKDNIKKVHSALLEMKKEEIDGGFKLKTYEEKIKFDLASALNLVDKDGEVDPKQVKGDLLKMAIMIEKYSEDNKLEEKLDILNDYIQNISNNTINKELIDGYCRDYDELQDIKDNIKEYKKAVEGGEEETIDEMFEKETLKGIEELVKMQVKEYKFDKENEWREEQGMNAKEEKVDTETHDLILQLAKILNISL